MISPFVCISVAFVQPEMIFIKNLIGYWYFRALTMHWADNNIIGFMIHEIYDSAKLQWRASWHLKSPENRLFRSYSGSFLASFNGGGIRE